MPLQYNSGIVTKPEGTPVVLASGANILYTAPSLASDSAKKGVLVHQVLVANADGSARTVLLDLYNGTTSYPIIPSKSIAANTYELLTFDFSIDAHPTLTWTLRATPSAANVLTVHLTMSQKP